jgi:tetratricopeptide (TPR) repeat protein
MVYLMPRSWVAMNRPWLVGCLVLWASGLLGAGEAPAEKPSPAEEHYRLGVQYGKQGQHLKAEQELRQAIRLNPGWAEAHSKLGSALAGQKRYAAAEKEYLKAIRLNPAYELSFYNLTCCYALWGKKKEAVKSFQTLVDKGFYNWPLMVDDHELDGLREDPGFRALDEIVKKRWEEREKTNPGK